MGEQLGGSHRVSQGRKPAHDVDMPFPGGAIYLSFPGLGDRQATRAAGEIGDHPEGFESPNALRCYRGKMPVIRRSGKSELVVSTRPACNCHLADAVQHWAFCSLRRSGLAQNSYDAQWARGKGHPAAVKALGNGSLEILWHCLNEGVLYDEAAHVANRSRAFSRAA